jgi:hypothetical protein
VALQQVAEAKERAIEELLERHTEDKFTQTQQIRLKY